MPKLPGPAAMGFAETLGQRIRAALGASQRAHPTSADWAPTTILSGDVAAQVAGLIDELRLVIAPVVLGDGRRLFSGATATGLRLIDSQTTPGGLAIHTYATAGSPEYATYQPGQ